MPRTKTERRIKVAELKGWTHCEIRNGDKCIGFPPNKPPSRMVSLPDYEGDANLWAAMLIEINATDTHFVDLCNDPHNNSYRACLYGANAEGKLVTNRTFDNKSLAIAVIEAWIAWKEQNENN